ncbi:MAG: ATP-binding protein [Pseudomonadota bacterium]
MRPMTDNELDALLDDVESDRAERKMNWAGDASEKVRQAVCAFANDLPNHQLPGIIFIGAKDDGAPSTITIDDKLLKTLSDIKTDGKTVPPPTLTVEKRMVKGVDMAVISVWPADAPPVRYEGRIWIRIGPRRGLASAQDERILNEKRRYRDLHFEAHPVSACSLADLSRAVFEHEYLPNAVAPDVLEANERSYEQRLASCGMVAAADQPIPTVLGLIVCGVSPRTWLPGNYIQFLRIQGTSLADPVIDEAEIDGTVGVMLRSAEDKLKAHLATSVDFTSQSREVRSSAYPLTALQQLVRNAVLHRTYENTNAPVRIYWFSDRIEIINPGGPYGSVNAQNFGKPGFADYRNPQLAAAFKVLGYAQRFGAGIAVAKQELQKNGNPPPEFQIEQNFIAAIIRKAP